MTRESDNEIVFKKNEEIIKKLVKLKDINSIKKYLHEKNIKLKDLNRSKCNILLYFIDNNASIDIINYIIINGKYITLNNEFYHDFIFENGKKYELRISPLKLAIKNNNFKLANYLIENGANTEFHDFYKSYRFCNIINSENIEYILNKGYRITSDLLKELIQLNKNDCLCSVLKHLSSPLFSRNFAKEKGFKPLLRKSIYKFCIDINNYNSLSILYHFDPRNKKRIANDIYDILSTVEEKEKFLNNIKNDKNKLLFNLDELYSFLTKGPLSIPRQELKEIIFSLIKNNKFKEIKKFFKKYEINMTKLMIINGYNRCIEFIRDNIKDQISPKMLDFIIHQCYKDTNILYENFNIDELMFEALKYHNFKCANYLIEKFPNYQFRMFFIWLCNGNSITSRNLNYILLNRHEFKIRENYNSFFYIKDLCRIQYKYYSELPINQKIFKYFIFNNVFILKLLSFYHEKKSLSTKEMKNMIYQEKNKISIDKSLYLDAIIYKMDDNLLNILYENDLRDKKAKLNDLFELFQKHCDLDVTIDKIKNGVYTFPINEDMIFQLENCIMIRESIFNLIDKRNVTKLKKFLSSYHIEFNDLKKFNNEQDDFLCYAIDRDNPSMAMIYFLMKSYDNHLNFFIRINETKEKKENGSSDTDKYFCPLSCALTHSHFSIAKILIKHGANINYIKKCYPGTSIFDIFQRNHQLSYSNIKFMLKHGLKISSYEISLLLCNQKKLNQRGVIQISINYYNKDDNDDDDDDDDDDKNRRRKREKKKNNKKRSFNYDIMEYIFKYFLFDNALIIKFLTIYKNKVILSDEELNNIIYSSPNRINDFPYEDAICCNDNIAIELFIKYDNPKTSIFQNINCFYSHLISAIEEDNIFFIKKIFQSNLIDFSQFNVKTFYSSIDHSLRYIHPLSYNNNYNDNDNENDEGDDKNNNKIEIADDDYDLESVSTRTSGSGNYYYVCAVGGKMGFDVLFNSLIENNYINFKINNFETDLLIFFRKRREFLDIKYFILKSFQNKTFSFENISFSNILYHILYNSLFTKFDERVELSYIFIEKALLHKTFDYTKIDMSKCIRYLMTIEKDYNFLILKKLLKELMKCQHFNLDITTKNEIYSIISICDNDELITSAKKILFI